MVRHNSAAIKEITWMRALHKATQSLNKEFKVVVPSAFQPRQIRSPRGVSCRLALGDTPKGRGLIFSFFKLVRLTDRFITLNYSWLAGGVAQALAALKEQGCRGAHNTHTDDQVTCC